MRWDSGRALVAIGIIATIALWAPAGAEIGRRVLSCHDLRAGLLVFLETLLWCLAVNTWLAVVYLWRCEVHGIRPVGAPPG